MVSRGDLDITVVYSDDGAVSPRARHGASIGGFAGRRSLGCLVLLAAASWMYVTWFPANHFLNKELLLAIFNFVDPATLFAPPPAHLANPSRPDTSSPKQPTPKTKGTSAVSAFRSGDTNEEPSPNRQAEALTIINRLTVANYVWVAVMTVTGCWLAMTGAAGLTGWLAKSGWAGAMRFFGLLMLAAVGTITWKYWPPPGGQSNLPQFLQYAYAGAFALLAWTLCVSSSRGGSVWGFVIGLAVLGAYVGLTYRAYPGGWGLPTWAWLAFSFGVMVVAAFLGAVLSSHVRGLTSAAVVLIFLSCAVTIAAMLYAQHSGGFVTYTPTTTTYVKVIAAQSFFGWLLLGTKLVSRRRTFRTAIRS